MSGRAQGLLAQSGPGQGGKALLGETLWDQQSLRVGRSRPNLRPQPSLRQRPEVQGGRLEADQRIAGRARPLPEGQLLLAGFLEIPGIEPGRGAC